MALRYRIGDDIIDPAFLPHHVKGTVTALAHGMVRVHWHMADDYEWLPVTDITKL